MFETQVQAGVARLNDWTPGWLDHVDVDALDMVSAVDCVAGQVGRKLLGSVWSPFSTTLRALNIPLHDEAAFGFDISEDISSVDDRRAAYVALNAEWTRVITDLKVASAAHLS
jgi:hypothetical protein